MSMHAWLVIAGFYPESDINAIETIYGNNRHRQVYHFFFGKFTAGI